MQKKCSQDIAPLVYHGIWQLRDVEWLKKARHIMVSSNLILRLVSWLTCRRCGIKSTERMYHVSIQSEHIFLRTDTRRIHEKAYPIKDVSQHVHLPLLLHSFVLIPPLCTKVRSGILLRMTTDEGKYSRIDNSRTTAATTTG